MEQTVGSARHGEREGSTVGDVRALLATLDGPDATVPFDDGLHHLLASIATLRRLAERRM